MIPKKQDFFTLSSINNRLKQEPLISYDDVLKEYIDELTRLGTAEYYNFYANELFFRDYNSLYQLTEELLLCFIEKDDQIFSYFKQKSLDLPHNWNRRNAVEAKNLLKNNEIFYDYLIRDLIDTQSQRLTCLMRSKIPLETHFEFVRKYASLGLNKKPKLLRTNCEHLAEAFEHLKLYIQNKRLISSNLSHCIAQFPLIGSRSEDEKTYKTQLQVVELENAFQTLLRNDVRSTEHLKFVEQFAEVNQDGYIISLNISCLTDWHEAKEVFSKLHQTSFWGAWFSLMNFKQRYARHDCRVFDNRGINFLQEFSLQRTISESERIQQNTLLKKLFEKTLCYQNQAIEAWKEHRKTQLSFDEEEALLYIPNKKPVKLTTQNHIRFVSLFFPNNIPHTNGYDIRTIFRDVFADASNEHKTYLDKEENDKVYNMRDYLNEKILKESEFENFFVLEDKVISLNPTLLISYGNSTEI